MVPRQLSRPTQCNAQITAKCRNHKYKPLGKWMCNCTLSDEKKYMCVRERDLYAHLRVNRCNRRKDSCMFNYWIKIFLYIRLHYKLTVRWIILCITNIDLTFKRTEYLFQALFVALFYFIYKYAACKLDKPREKGSNAHSNFPQFGSAGQSEESALSRIWYLEVQG